MTTCGSCGRELVAGSSFCGYCGASTHAPDPGDTGRAGGEEATRDYWVCAQCHVENQEDSAFCSSCGALAPAQAVSAAAPGRDAPAPGSGSVTCGACGGETEGDSRFCSGCGAPLAVGRRSLGQRPVPSIGPGRSAPTTAPATRGASAAPAPEARKRAPEQDPRRHPDRRRCHRGCHRRLRILRRAAFGYVRRRRWAGAGSDSDAWEWL